MSFCYNVLQSVGNMYWCGCFSETVLIAIPNKIISAIGNESLIPYKKPYKKRSEAQNL